MRTAGRVSAIGMEFAGAVIGCLLAGWWLDGKLGTGPWLAAVGIILGSAVGFKAVYRTAKLMQMDAEAQAAAERRDDSDEERR
ncbi:AtpZ/AtpI family protein [Myxococcota bacterium]|nr:AtpZ/AtpI family protein [Myxococcota bacterium]